MSTNTLHRFMGISLELGPDVLVPREETELLGGVAVGLLGRMPADALAIDMCCGSGNLALGVAASVPGVQIWASDLTDATVQIARRNAERLGLAGRVFILQGDLFEPLRAAGLEDQVDLVMANPPYISTGRLVGDRAHLLDNEPREAFDGGPYGISIHQRLAAEAPAFLKPGGWLAFEFGEGQDRQALAVLARARAYEVVELVNDESGRPRVAIAQKKET